MSAHGLRKVRERSCKHMFKHQDVVDSGLGNPMWRRKPVMTENVKCGIFRTKEHGWNSKIVGNCESGSSREFLKEEHGSSIYVQTQSDLLRHMFGPALQG